MLWIKIYLLIATTEYYKQKYQRILKDFKSIDKLADFIDKIPVDDDMWKSRARNIKIYKKQIEHRNMLFFKEFWLE